MIGLVACGQPLDYDLRGGLGGFSTASAATGVATEPRPQPDDRGVISYPTYQVAIAESGDTVTSMAQRLGLDAAQLASFNGIDENANLRVGEVVALPARVAEPSAATGATLVGPISPGSVDISTVAGGAIERAGAADPGRRVETVALPASTPVQPEISGQEPIRHKVARGETAFTIARLYQVPVKSLGEWNGLGADFAIREGQFLLIPVAQAPAADTSSDVPAPGTGSPTPTPPSASTPLPEPETTIIPAPEPVDVGAATITPSNEAAMVFPIDGTIIREYAKGRNEGIDIKAAAGTPVRAADAGTVAAITKSAEGVPIIVVRHDPELLTVYANVTDVTVEKGTRVGRGEAIAKLRSGSDAFVHFEVRQGFDSVDPMQYLK
ncbi:MAG: peptidoglycan DD-metalloendopeptidase family protein [Roseobacter sp.]